MGNTFLESSFYTLVSERRLARFHPWILSGLILLYLFTFPLTRYPILITVPVAVAGWFYYRRAGLWAGLFALPMNIILVDQFMYKMSIEQFFLASNGFVVGHILVIMVGVGVGFLREELEDLYQIVQKDSLRERRLVLINMTVKDVLETTDINDSYYRLLHHLCNMFVADYAYLTYWNESPYRVTLLASTKMGEYPAPGSVFKLEEAVITMSVLETRSVLDIQNAQNSPLVLKSPLFKGHFSNIQTVLAIPLATKDYKFGAVILAFDKPKKFDPDEISQFETSSSQITLALKSILQERRIEKQLKEAHALASIELALSESERTGLDVVLQLIVNSACELMSNTTHAVLHLLDLDQQVLIPRAVSGNFEGRKSNRHMHLGEGVAGQVLSDGEAVTISDITTDSRFVNQTLPVTFRSIAVAPVMLNQKRIGTISVLGSEVGEFHQDDVNLLNSLGTLSAIAIENATLYDSMQNEIKERIKLESALRNSIASERELRLSAETTAEVSFALVSNLDEQTVLNEVLAQVEKLLPGFAYNVELIEDDRFLIVKAHRGYEKYGHDFSEYRRFPVEHLPLQWRVIQERKVLLVADTHNEDNWVTLPLYSWIRTHMCIPLLWKEQLLGILNIDHDAPNMLSEQNADGLRTLVNVAAVAIANAQLLDNTRQALNETSSLYDIIRGLVVLNFNELLVSTVELLQKNFGYYHVQVYLEDPDTGNLFLKAGSGVREQELLVGSHRLSAGAGIVGHVYDTSMPFFTNNVNEVLFFFRSPLLLETQSELAVPLKIGARTLGVLDIQQCPPRILTSRDLQLVGAVADQLAVSLRNAKLYEDLQSALEQEKNTRFQMMQIERLATVGRLLASISHELNNPLQAIQNVLFLLKSEENLSSQGQQDLEVILSETERMTSLIGRLRATYRTPHLDEFQDVHLNSVIEDVYALTATYMRHKKIAFEFYPDMEIPALPGIPDQIRQVLLNLFMNAIDAMQTGGKLLIQTKNLPEKKQILLSVSDTGTGISPEILPHIFEPFTTDKDTGTGLGMTITRDIILQHHGEIQARNNPEGGAEFLVWLPVTRQE